MNRAIKGSQAIQVWCDGEYQAGRRIEILGISFVGSSRDELVENHPAIVNVSDDVYHSNTYYTAI